MQLNKYDLVEFLTSKLRGASCTICPIRKECDEREDDDFICFDEDETKELLMKKYNI
jgi:hypothetical protein